MTAQTYDGFYVEPVEIKTGHGYSVSCYGDISEESTVAMVFDDENYDGISDSSFKTWSEAVKEISDYAELHELKLLELEAD